MRCGIAPLRHAELMGAQSEGRQIIADARGRPCWPRSGVPGLEELRASGDPRFDAEAERRILAWRASPRQSNDNALIAQAPSRRPLANRRPRALPRRLSPGARHRRPARHRQPHRRADRHDAPANLTGFDRRAAVGEG
jgi:hypothetical protein